MTSENIKCSFTKCDQGHVIPPWSARVDVRGFHVPKSKRKGMDTVRVPLKYMSIFQIICIQVFTKIISYIFKNMFVSLT